MDALTNTGPNARISRLSKGSIGGIVGIAGAVVMIYLLICGLHGQAVQVPPVTGSLTTRMGEHRCEQLPDATQVCLNTNTQLRYNFSQDARTVELISGEASFVVRSTDSRPFDVLSGGMLTHDLSTSFLIYRKVGTTLMTVMDGEVKVVAPINARSLQAFKSAAPESAWKSAPEFHRLQQAVFDESTGTLYARHSLTDEGLAQLLAWQRGRIDLNGRTLREALAEFARYQPVDRFNIPDRSLRDFQVGGELDATSLMDFLDTLDVVHHIHHTVTKSADGKLAITLTRRPVH